MTLNETVINNPIWWRRRTHMERCCTVIAAAALFLCGALTIALSVVYAKQIQNSEDTVTPNSSKLQRNYGKEENICLTPECVLAASQILKNMDPDIDPCDDFYGYVCGNFMKETMIPDDKTSVTLFSTIGDKLTEQLRLIIEEPPADDEPKPFRMVKELYKACMNNTHIEKTGLSNMKKILKRVGGWPVLDGDNWNATEFTWKDSTYKLRKEGFSTDTLIDFSIMTDFKNSRKRVIYLDQPSLSLSREYLVKGLDERVVEALFCYMVHMAVYFGADRDRAQKELKKALEFEIELANISLPPEQRRDANKLYNPMTISELQQKFPSIPWYEYFSNMLPESVHFNTDEVAIVHVPTYISNLEGLLNKTSKRVQANYLLWRAVTSAVFSLTEVPRSLQLQYETSATGRTAREPRWKECIVQSTGRLYLAVGSLYVKHYFKEDAKKNVLEMVDNLSREMFKILQSVDWMDNQTRQTGLEKVNSMTAHIAYPDELLDVNKLEEFYDKLELNSESYLEAVLNLTKFQLEYSFNQLRKPVNKTDWVSHGHSAVINAFYSAEENSIQFPAGFLQGTLFSNDRPKYLNYGSIGYVIGHEITHGFDEEGQQFDKDGNLVDWWETETKKAFLKRASCITNQYGNYTAEQVGLHLLGINTQGENIADNGGIKQAYLAYNHWAKDHGEEKRLPGLQHLTPQQMFWVSAANTWCSKYRSETLEQHIFTNPHSPAEFRVLGPMSNRPEFAQDFKCPPGSKMNPVKKCQVW